MNSRFNQAIEDRIFSGASFLFATPERILFECTWGTTSEKGEHLSKHTHFDLASLTKPIVTAAICITAVSSRELSLSDTLERFFPSSSLPADKKEITLRQLLNHSAGFPPYEPYYRELIQFPLEMRREVLLTRILSTPLVSVPGTKNHYSDLGYILLGAVLETHFGRRIDQLARDRVFAPIGTDELDFRPCPASSVLERELQSPLNRQLSFVATEQCGWRNRLLVGEVHDENAFCLGGVAAHAGLFGTARGIFYFLRFLWRIFKGHLDLAGWSASVIESFFTRDDSVPDSTWALGFDTPTPGFSTSGDYLSPFSIGHLGFTGTSFWMDLQQEVILILLTNRVYPTRENQGLKSFRPLIHNLAMEAFHELYRPS